MITCLKTKQSKQPNQPTNKPTSQQTKKYQLPLRGNTFFKFCFSVKISTSQDWGFQDLTPLLSFSCFPNCSPRQPPCCFSSWYSHECRDLCACFSHCGDLSVLIYIIKLHWLDPECTSRSTVCLSMFV